MTDCSTEARSDANHPDIFDPPRRIENIGMDHTSDGESETHARVPMDLLRVPARRSGFAQAGP